MLQPHELTTEVRADLYQSLLKSHARILRMAEFKGLTKKQAAAHRALAASKLEESKLYKD